MAQIQWQRDYREDEADFWALRQDAGWMFRGTRAERYWRYWGDDFAEAYAEFGVTPSGLPVRRTP